MLTRLLVVRRARDFRQFMNMANSMSGTRAERKGAKARGRKGFPVREEADGRYNATRPCRVFGVVWGFKWSGTLTLGPGHGPGSSLFRGLEEVACWTILMGTSGRPQAGPLTGALTGPDG
jgi:hypothetical protein